MPRLTNSTDTLAKLQSRLYRLQADKKDLKAQVEILRNRVAAAESAARATTVLYTELLELYNELVNQLENNND